MAKNLAIYWGEDSKLYPQVADILSSVFTNYGLDSFYEWTPDLSLDVPVLGLNAEPPVRPIKFVKTLSQKQIMSAAAGVTELNAALDLLYKPQPLPKMEYEVWDAPGYKMLNQVFPKNKPLVIDIENSSSGRDYDVLLPEETYLISLAIFDGDKLVVLSEEWLANPDNLKQLGDFLTDGRKLIAHNMKFDFRTLTAILGREIKGHCDTMLMLHAILPGTKQFKLEEACVKYLGVEDWKMDKVGKQYFANGNPDFAQIPRPVLYKYNAMDVFNTWYLYKYLEKAATGSQRIIDLIKFEATAANAFQEIEANGVAVDLAYMEELDATLRKQHGIMLDKIRKLTNMPEFNPNSYRHVQRVLLKLDNGKVYKSTEEKILLKAKPRMTPIAAEFVDMLLELRGLWKLIGTYLGGIRKRLHNGNLVYPTFKIHGTNTGRLSSADPNIQNIPRDAEVSLRRMFIPRDDPEGEPRTLLNVDYGQAELRVMAVLSKDPYLISLFQPDSPDFFDALMPTAFPREDIKAWSKEDKKNFRAKLKAMVYGLSYNRQAKAIAEDLKMSVKEAEAIIRNYFKAAPDLYDWRQWIIATALSEDDVLETPFGRYFQSEVVTGRNKQNVINSSLAFLPQSTASDLCVSALVRVQAWLKETGLAEHNFIIASVHDAILLDVRVEDAQRIGEKVQFEMADAGRRMFGDTVLFATDMTTGPSWEGI